MDACGGGAAAAASGWQVPAEPTMPRLNSQVDGFLRTLALCRPLEVPPLSEPSRPAYVCSAAGALTTSVD